MGRITRVQKGGLVPVTIEFRERRRDTQNGQRIDPNGCVAQLLNPDGTNQGSPLNCTWARKGDFVFYWDTSALAVGDYRAKIRFGYAFSTDAGGVTKIGEVDVILRLVNAA